MATNGVNTYLYRYGKGSIDGSFTTDSDGNLKAVNHIDEMYIRDNIKYNLVKNIYLWLNSSEMASMSDYAELELEEEEEEKEQEEEKKKNKKPLPPPYSKKILI